jgi:IS30 family transposase
VHDQSPEAVVGRLKHVEKNMGTISASAARRYIKSPYGRHIEAHRIKIFGKKRRKGGRKKRIEDNTIIDKRPKRINDRKGLEHMVGDFIVSGRSGKGLMFSLVDRKVRITLLERILPVSVKNVEHALVRMKTRYPEMQTITFDNNMLFLEHKRLARIFEINIYFARPHTPWDKPSVENGNGVLRRYIPKSSDISTYSRHSIRKLEARMNNRFMEYLLFRTPHEVYEKEKKRHKTQKNR